MQSEKIRTLLAELAALKEQMESWQSSFAIPAIEKDLALNRMQQMYAMLKELAVQNVSADTLSQSQPESVIIIETATETALSEETTRPDITASGLTVSIQESMKNSERSISAQHPEETLLERLSKLKEEKSLADRFSTLPVKDLKKSIGINERFQYINELFEGNVTDFNHLIDRLNACPVKEEALRLLQEEYALRREWNTQGETYRSLVALIERKFV
jgi:hypothetical protein